MPWGWCDRVGRIASGHRVGRNASGHNSVMKYVIHAERIDPAGARLVVVPTTDGAYDGPIELSDDASERLKRPLSGVVQSLGPAVSDQFMVGDRVMFGRYAGTEVDLDGGTVLVLLESDIIGILR